MSAPKYRDRAASPFTIGQAVRYKPGFGTYGYEDALEEDGRVPGVVIGFTRTRVRIELTLTKRFGTTVRRAVDPASLQGADGVPRGTSPTPLSDTGRTVGEP